MKGNEVIAHAAIRYGCDGYFGYPITPQSEVMETLMEEKPWERPVWSCCRQSRRLHPPIWFMVLLRPVNV